MSCRSWGSLRMMSKGVALSEATGTMGWWRKSIVEVGLGGATNGFVSRKPASSTSMHVAVSKQWYSNGCPNVTVGLAGECGVATCWANGDGNCWKRDCCGNILSREKSRPAKPSFRWWGSFLQGDVTF